MSINYYQPRRPRYEKPEDLVVEKRAADLFANLIPAKTRETLKPKKEDTDDYDIKVILDGILRCILEHKGRTGSGDRFETWHIAKDKLVRCMAHAKKLGVPFFMLFSWDEGVFYRRINPEDIDKFELRMGGRWDRGDIRDVELMAHMPRSSFTRVSG